MRNARSVAVVVLVLVLAACGSSGKSSSGGSAALSKADFVSQANSICKSLGQTDPEGDPTDAKGLATFLGNLNAQMKDARSKIAALKAPSDAQQLQKDFLALIDKVTATGDVAKAKADAGDMQGAESALSSIDSAALDKQMKDYGLTECVGDSQP